MHCNSYISLFQPASNTWMNRTVMLQYIYLISTLQSQHFSMWIRKETPRNQEKKTKWSRKIVSTKMTDYDLGLLFSVSRRPPQSFILPVFLKDPKACKCRELWQERMVWHKKIEEETKRYKTQNCKEWQRSIQSCWWRCCSGKWNTMAGIFSVSYHTSM